MQALKYLLGICALVLVIAGIAVLGREEHNRNVPKETDDQVIAVPEEEEVVEPETASVTVYFPNASLAGDSTDCSLVFPVTRDFLKSDVKTETPLLELLVGVALPEAEAGYMTEIPANVRLVDFTLIDGVFHATFSKELDEGVAGSCRVGAIRAQIEKTLMAIPGVTSVQISIEGKNDEEILQP